MQYEMRDMDTSWSILTQATVVQGSKLKKMFGRKFATGYENLVATLKMLVAKLIEAI